MSQHSRGLGFVLEHREGMAQAVRMFYVSEGVQVEPVGLKFWEGGVTHWLRGGAYLPAACRQIL